MNRKKLLTTAGVTAALAVLWRPGLPGSAQDKYTLKLPNGLAFLRIQGIRRLAGGLSQPDRQNCSRWRSPTPR